MNKYRQWAVIAVLSAAVALVGRSMLESRAAAEGASKSGVVFISVTSDPKENPQAVDMAIKFAGFALDEGRKVVLFFTVKGVRVPVQSLPEDFAFGDNKPIRTQLTDVIKRGVEVHVCPVCMKGLNIKDSELVSGAQVTTRPKLFSHIHADTAVFTF